MFPQAVVFAQCLVLLLASALYSVNRMLSDFRAPLLYALLGSVALRGTKGALSSYLRLCLQHSLAAAVSSPVLWVWAALRDTYADAAALLRQPMMGSKLPAGLRAGQSLSFSFTSPRSAGGASAILSPFSPKSTIGKAFFRRRESKDLGAGDANVARGGSPAPSGGNDAATDARAPSAAAPQAPQPRSADAHFRWLLRAVALHLCWRYRAPLAPLVDSLVAVAVAPLALLFVARLGLALGARPIATLVAALEAREGPLAKFGLWLLWPLRRRRRRRQQAEDAKERTSRTMPGRVTFANGSAQGAREGLRLRLPHAAAPKPSPPIDVTPPNAASSRARTTDLGISWWTTAARALLDALRASDASLRHSMAEGVEPLVAGLLVVGVLLGIVVVGVFFTVQIAAEGHDLLRVLSERVKGGGTIQSLHETYTPMVVDYVHGRVSAFVQDYNLSSLADDMTVIWEQYAAEVAAPAVSEAEDAAPGVRELHVLSWRLMEELSALERSIRAADFGGAMAAARGALSAAMRDLDSDLRERASEALAPLRASANHLLGAARGVAGGSAALAGNVAGWVLGRVLDVATTAFKFIVFTSVFYYLLAAERTAVEMVVSPLPLTPAHRARAAHVLETAVRGVVVSTAKMAAFHAVFTWLTFSVFGVDFAFLAAAAASIFAVMPILAAWNVALPAAAQLLAQGRGWQGALLLVLHIYVTGDVADAIYSEIPGSHPYLTGLAIFSGMWAFDDLLQGAIVAPLTVCIITAIVQLYKEMTDEVEKETEQKESDFEN